MTELFSINAITALMPKLVLTVPVVGALDVTKLLAATGLFVVLTCLFWLLRTIVLTRLRTLSQKTNGAFDDTLVTAVSSVRAWVYTLVALYVSLQFFSLPKLLEQIIDGVFYFVIVWQLIAISMCFIKYATVLLVEKDDDGDGVVDANSATVADMIVLIVRIVLWVLGVIFVLSNIGIEVTSLVAGLGIGGIAIAFALQGVLADLFASFSLYFDKPFRIGDFIVIGTDSGTVEKIGIKTTRIRTLQGEELVVSNAELTTTRVQNFKKMEERRIVTTFGITYETPQEKVQKVTGIVERIFEALDGGRLDRVHFTTFADSALLFELVYYVESPDYDQYLDIQQAFNFDLMTRFAELGIEFAYPTQTIYAKQVS